MRAKEFISESKKGKISNRHRQSTKGLNVFAKTNNNFDRQYDLNRLMMAVACTDGISPIDINSESWIGKYNSAHPYTKEEQDMLNIAYKTVGLVHKDLNNGDLNSQELTDTNVTSVIKPFKGYKK
jgi:hypothetical protein